MLRTKIWFVILCMLIGGCTQGRDSPGTAKVVDFELSPDENKVAFSATTPTGNTDIWVVDIDGKNLRKITHKDRSPTNKIARFFRKRKWRNFFKIDVHSPSWTTDGRIVFCEEITRHHAHGINSLALRYWTTKPDGSDKSIKKDTDKISARRPFDPINRAIISDQSGKNKKRIILKDGILWTQDYGKSNLKKLIQ